MEGESVHGRTRNSARGFTIVEILIVVAAIGAIALIAVPRFGFAQTRYRVDLAARRLVADLERTRTAARAASTDRALVIDAEASEYTMDGVRDLDGSGSGSPIKLAAEPYGVAVLQPDFGGAAKVIYSGFGAVRDGGRVFLRVGQNVVVVEVDEATGNPSWRRATRIEIEDLGEK